MQLAITSVLLSDTLNPTKMMNRLIIMLNTYRSLGVIPDPDNFEAIINILEELNFKKSESSTAPLTRKEISDWLIQFIKKNDKGVAPQFPDISALLAKLNNKTANKLLRLRFGNGGEFRNFEGDFDDLHND